MKKGAEKLNWINEQISNGKTVYFHTQTRITKITKKYLSMVSGKPWRAVIK